MIMVVIVALATAAATWLVGWWAVAVIALIAGFLYAEDPATPWRAAIGAALGWLLLLVIDMAAGPFGRLASALGGAMSVPWPALLIVTVLLAALMGWSAAAIAVEAWRGLGLKSAPQ